MKPLSLAIAGLLALAATSAIGLAQTGTPSSDAPSSAASSPASDSMPDAAKTSVTDTEPATAVFATIDPRAGALLARLNQKYSRARTYQDVTELILEDGPHREYSRLRIQIEPPVRAVITRSSPQSATERSVFDGRSILKTNSRFPKRYMLQELGNINFAGRGLLAGFARSEGFDCAAADLLITERFGSLLLEPALRAVDWGTPETIDGKPMQTVVLHIRDEKSEGSLTLTIDETALLLRRVVAHEEPVGAESRITPFTFTETHNDIKFDEDLPDSLFSTMPAKGSKPISDFGESVTLSATTPRSSASIPSASAPPVAKHR